ncbi:MAG TPA: thioesterase [Bacillota bacterium]|nr:thioesterase [Bacillota bacterium]
MNGIFEKKFCLHTTDVNMHDRLRTSALFAMLENIAGDHISELGASRASLRKRGLLWVITAHYVQIDRLPSCDEEIVLKTWPGKARRVLLPRYYSAETLSGEHLFSACSDWSVVDMNSRAFATNTGIELPELETGSEVPRKGIPKKPDMTEIGHFEVPFSYADINGHMNNTRYFDLAEDFVPQAAAGLPLKALRAEYRSEVRPGETLTVKRGELDGEIFISGELEKDVCFRIGLRY